MSEPLSKAEISKAVRSNEIESTHRVYEKQWLFCVRLATRSDVVKYFESHYEGRVYPEDMRIEQDGVGPAETWKLHLRRWSVLAEWKNFGLAQQHAVLLLEDDSGREVEAVERNSRREHVLTDYGKLKLPDLPERPDAR